MKRAALRAVPPAASSGPDLQGWIGAYLDHLRVERALSQRTLDAYTRDLAALAAHVGSAAAVESIGREALASFFSSESARGLGARSAARHLSALRGFFRFLVGEGVLAKDPTRFVDPPRVPKRLPRFLTTSQVLDLVEVTPAGARGVQQTAIVLLLFACGVRASEFVALDVGDVDLARGLLTVRRGKGGRGRVVPIAPVALAAVREYLEAVRPVLAEPEERALFVAERTGRRLSRFALNDLLRRLGRAAGIEGAVYPHMLRHSFATALLRGGANLVAVQRLLGHADLGSTAIYTHVDTDQLRLAHRKTHPRG